MATLRQERARLRALPEEEHLDNSPETVAQRRNMFARMGWDTSDLPEIPVVDASATEETIEFPESVFPGPNIVPAPIPDAVAEPGVPYNAVTGANYTGKNVMRLIMAEAEHGFGVGGWAGFGQWRSIGRTVKRGEQGTGIVRMGTIAVDGETETGDHSGRGQVRPFGSRVFHFDQTTELVPNED